MTTNAAQENKPLWLSMEGMILELADQDLAAGSKEATIQRLAGNLDAAGYGVAGHAGNMLELRSAVTERIAAGRPLLKDFEAALGALGIEDVENPRVAAAKLALDVGTNFPLLKALERRPDILTIVERKRLDLLVAKADELGGEKGVRSLIAAGVDVATIIARLGISQADYDAVDAKIAAERTERKRVQGLIAEAGETGDADRIKLLIDKDVADELIVEIGGFDQAAIDEVKQAMAAELAEKKRLAEEEAARKQAEAEGPALETISNEDMLDYIENIREILEFSDVAKEIQAMCEQSDIPKCLIEIAINAPDKLDELEANAEG